MKFNLWCASAVCLAMMLAAFQSPAKAQTTSDAEALRWLESASEAAEQARATGKPILVYIRSENCHYCDLLQKKTWQDPKVRAMILNEMIPLKLTLEDNRDVVQAMKVRGYPSTLLFSADREYLTRIDGYVTPQEFTARISKVHVPETSRLAEIPRR